MHVARFTTGYMDNAIFDLTETVDKAVAELTPHLDKFDTIVGTGFSGGMVIPMLTTMLNKKFVLIRKETDDSHHGSGRLLGELGERWIFVDDFCQSGGTKLRVIEKIREAAEDRGHTTTYVGNYYYGGYRLDTNYRENGHLELLHPALQIEMGAAWPEVKGASENVFEIDEAGEVVEPTKSRRDNYLRTALSNVRYPELEKFYSDQKPESFKRFTLDPSLMGGNPGAKIQLDEKAPEDLEHDNEPLAEWEKELLYGPVE